MKHIGKILKDHIEKHGLVKGEVAGKVGITYNYLSTIFKKQSIDALLLEKLCLTVGLDPAVMFDAPEFSYRNTLTDGQQHQVSGAVAASINERDALLDLLAEKERTIQILMKANGINDLRKAGTESGQIQ